EKIMFGKNFKNDVNNGSIPQVRYVGKAQNNSARYIKCK
ncbi:MAG: DUF1413 domain-containing protein, partial [Enterococcus sp.]|nr:DUF1413 domain-containing protein [Enterococcus sp.]